MYPFGLVTLLELLLELELPALFVLVAICLFLSVVLLRHRNQRHQDAPATLPQFPLFNITSFLKKRHDFLARGFEITNQRLFQFRLLRVRQTLVPVALAVQTFSLTLAHPS